MVSESLTGIECDTRGFGLIEVRYWNLPEQTPCQEALGTCEEYRYNSFLAQALAMPFERPELEICTS